MALQVMATDSAKVRERRPVQIGKYQVLGHIATGGMGAIYRAVDVELDRQVALKVLSPGLAAKDISLKRFRREARSAARLRHPNIVAIYERGEANGLHFLALEYIDGIDLLAYITRNGKLDPEEARQILMQAAKALEHAHKQGIVHRDIKPSNFLITNKDGKLRVKLTDLGLARIVREEEFRLTAEGTTLGTVDYMSPEQARDGNSADIRSDIYSLGCTFYHMLAGTTPFAKGTLAERLLQHFDTKAPDIRDLNARVPEGLALILARMLEKKPADRYQTPSELLKDLEDPQRVKTRVSSGERLAVLAKLAGPGASGTASPSQHPPLRVAERKVEECWPHPVSRTPVGSASTGRFRVDDEPKRKRVQRSWLSDWIVARVPALRNKSVARLLRDHWLFLASSMALTLGVGIILLQLLSGR
jgi:serine/threonine protein kinase